MYGMIIYEDGLRYLLFDDCETPYWYPAELFEVVENKIAESWYYKFLQHSDEAISAIWGYFELVHSEKHFDGLSEQEQQAVDLFFERRKDIDN
ncbi:MAG TPA: hypothetical protein VNS08_04595 [Ureibacillus sp.]|nr:hypothetical protein [Ureibacillus sp.]